MTFVNDTVMHLFITGVCVVVYFFGSRGRYTPDTDKDHWGWRHLHLIVLAVALVFLIVPAALYVFDQQNGGNLLGYAQNSYIWYFLVGYGLTAVLMEFYKKNAVQIGSPGSIVSDAHEVQGYELSHFRFKHAEHNYNVKAGLFPTLMILLISFMFSADFSMKAKVLYHSKMYSTTGLSTTVRDWEHMALWPTMITMISLWFTVSSSMWNETPLIFYNPQAKIEIMERADEKTDKSWMLDHLPRMKMVFVKIPPFAILAYSAYTAVFSGVYLNDFGRFLIYNAMVTVFPHMVVSLMQTYAAWFEAFVVGNLAYAVAYFFFIDIYVMRSRGTGEAANNFTVSGDTAHLLALSDSGNTDLIYRASGSWTDNTIVTSQYMLSTLVVVFSFVYVLFALFRLPIFQGKNGLEGFYEQKPVRLEQATFWKFAPKSVQASSTAYKYEPVPV